METGTNMPVNEVTQGPKQEIEISASIELCLSLAQEILASIDKLLSVAQSGGCPNLAAGPPDSPPSPRSPRSEITRQPFKAERTEMISKKRKTFWGRNSQRSRSPQPVNDDAADDDEEVLHVDDDKRRRSSSFPVTIARQLPRAAKGAGDGGAGSKTTCQVENCVVNLSEARAYHRRHRVCGAHSKTPIVIVAGLQQRFCHQCSRFHELAEFDGGKRTCRRGLAIHNERRRKSFSESQGDPVTKCSDSGEIQSRDVTRVGRYSHEMNGSVDIMTALTRDRLRTDEFESHMPQIQ